MAVRQSRSGVQLGAATTAVNGGTAGARTKSAPRMAGLAGAGPTAFLWLLVAVEVGVLALMRYVFRDHHGG